MDTPFNCKPGSREWIEASFIDPEGNTVCNRTGFDKYRVFILQGTPPKGCVIADYVNNEKVKMMSVLFRNKTYTFNNICGNGTLGDLKKKLA